MSDRDGKKGKFPDQLRVKAGPPRGHRLKPSAAREARAAQSRD